MKRKLLHLLILPILFVSQTALSQEAAPSAAEINKKFEEVLNELANSVNYTEAVTRTIDTLKKWHGKMWRVSTKASATLLPA
jgi:hypothetical protein